MAKRQVVIGLIGATLDQGFTPARWDRWRPTVALAQHDDLIIDRLELLWNPKNRGEAKLVAQIKADLTQVAPEAEIRTHDVALADPWDFADVFATLGDFFASYPFDPAREDYFLHITTGTHVVQICLFLLAETRVIPARLLQTSPRGDHGGSYSIIDLDLGRYDRLLARQEARAQRAQADLKAGIATLDPTFNAMIAQLEAVATVARDPLLLLGETGTGKSVLAERIYQLKRTRHQLTGEFVAVNCATLRGDGAMSTLFGHAKGAFTGALTARDGLLKKAEGGLLFLDEIGELGGDEQAMLLTALEHHRFYPLGSDRETHSDFQLIVGTHRDLEAEVAAGRFREDLLARISLWPFVLPPLRARRADLAPNLEVELTRVSASLGARVTMSHEARAAFLTFAASEAAPWPRNFRDWSASIRRMATLAAGGRISEADVDREVTRLRAAWAGRVGGMRDAAAPSMGATRRAEKLLGPRWATLDRFDRVQLADVLEVCAASSSLSAAGRTLFAHSLETRRSHNDADRLRKYLARFGLTFAALRDS